MPRKNTLVVLAFLCFSMPLFSQERAHKWGDIPESDIKMTVYPQDSTASMVVLQDVGKMVVRANTGAVTLYRNRRLKILDASALKEGNLMIHYRANKGADELRDLDIQLITPDGVKKKVKADNVFTEKLQRGWAAKKVFIPGLQKGSIIEYRYQLVSDDIVTLYDWYFQEDVPVRWSEIETTIPEYYDYVILSNLSGAFDLKETSQSSDADGHNTYINRWGLANNPALKEEPYVTSMEDQLSSIKFQLRTLIFPGKPSKTIISTWTELAKELEDDDRFGQQYKKSGNFDQMWEAFSPMLAAGDTPQDKIKKAHHFVAEHISWNGYYRFFTEKDIDDAFVKQTGNSADINLALVALLRKAGLKATPLLLSTRSNGRMYAQYPFHSQFNAVIALVEDGDKVSILDATNPFLPVNQLSNAYYHGAAWMVDKNAPNWVDITAPEASETWYGKIQLKETGEMTGNFSIQTAGNFASKWRSELDSTQAKNFLLKHFGSSDLEMKFDSVSFSKTELLDQPLSVKFNCQLSGAASVVNDFIYCQPVLDFIVMKNPFKSLTRDFPVEFETPFKAQYIVDLVPPSGYTLEELPPPARVNLPDNAGKLSFNCAKNPNGVIQVILRMNIAQTEFGPETYGALRQFFELMVEKTQLQIVLKKA